jgi:vacuolar protein sorting-associated protein 53
MSEELPHELLLSISRILDLRESSETDPLDTVGGQFNVIDIINHYFPNGASYSRQCQLNYQCRRVVLLEESLGQLNAVQVQLAQDEWDLRQEIARLQDELRPQQGHGKIQLIQEMISVCPETFILHVFLLIFCLCARTFWVRCLSSGKRLPSLKPSSVT